MNNFHLWEPGDDAYMKMILRELGNGKTYRNLGTRLHPIGDFDSPGARIPGEPARVYRTARGLRVFFIGRYGEPPGDFLESLVDLGCDPLYSKMCRQRGYYAARVDPKIPGYPGNTAVTALVGQTGEAHPGWDRFIRFHDELTRALEPGTILV